MKFQVSGQKVNLPYSSPDNQINIYLSGSNVVIETNIGLTVYYDGNSVFKVRLANAYGGHVSGLCGNMDGNPNNDLTLASNPNSVVIYFS